MNHETRDMSIHDEAVLIYYIFLFFFLSKISNIMKMTEITDMITDRVPSVKTLRSPLSAEFWRHWVLSGRTQRRAMPRYPSEEMET